jgi:hypothetical protein
MDKYVFPIICVVGYEVRSAGAKDNKASVGANHAGSTVCVSLASAAADTHALSDAGLPVVDEYIFPLVGVARDKIRGAGCKSDEAPISTDIGVQAQPDIGLVTSAIDTDSLSSRRDGGR